MSTAARKARKRAGVKFERKAKVPTGRAARSRSVPFEYLTSTTGLRAVWRALFTGGRW